MAVFRIQHLQRHYGRYSLRRFQPGSGEDLAQLRGSLCAGAGPDAGLHENHEGPRVEFLQ